MEHKNLTHMTAKERFMYNQKIIDSYVENSSKLKDIVSIFRTLTKHKNITTIHIGVGKFTSENTFESLLESHMHNPRIVLSQFNNEPMILISEKYSTLLSINLALIYDVTIEANEYNDSLNNFDEYNIRYSISSVNGKIDYWIKIVEYK